MSEGGGVWLLSEGKRIIQPQCIGYIYIKSDIDARVLVLRPTLDQKLCLNQSLGSDRVHSREAGSLGGRWARGYLGVVAPHQHSERECVCERERERDREREGEGERGERENGRIVNKLCGLSVCLFGDDNAVALRRVQEDLESHIFGPAGY